MLTLGESDPMQKISLKIEPKTDLKYEDLPYQKEAFEKIKQLDYSAIFLEQGLGKTKIAIDLIAFWLNYKIVDTILVITKKTLIENWKNEFERHSYFHPAILTNNKANNYYVFNGPYRVILTNFEIIQVELSRFKLFLETREVAIIIDESAKIKNPESKLTRCFFELSDLFAKKVIMTGTPVSNRPYDIWSQIYFLDKGKSLGSDFNKFKKDTELLNSFDKESKARSDFESSISSIYDKISDFSVRETKDSGIISLPPKIYKTILTNFEPEQKEMYDSVCNDALLFILKDGEFDIDDSEAIIKRLTRLIQITSNPRLISDSYCQYPGKLIPLKELVNSIVSNNEKCIIWTNYIQNVEWLSHELSEYSPVKIHGSMDMESRNKSVYDFKNSDANKILIATPAAAKEGLTLTVANHSIFYDRSLSLDDYLQAQDRIHRISQTKECYIYNIQINHSIDQWIDKLIASKSLAAKLAQGDITIEQYKQIADYSYASIIKTILGGNNE